MSMPVTRPYNPNAKRHRRDEWGEYTKRVAQGEPMTAQLDGMLIEARKLTDVAARTKL
jgi:hypothetical protein